jgi:recombination endonuclease VII
LNSHKRKGDRAEIEVQGILRARRNAQRRAQRARRRMSIDPAAEWHGSTNGYVNHCCRCEPCRTAYRDYINEWRKRPHVAERIRARAREMAKQPKTVLRKKATQYGIDVETLEVHLSARVCFACGAEDVELAIDHDHACCPSTRKACGDCVRGLLCHDCNKALGLVKDDIARLRALIAYLERWEAKRASQ